MFASTRAVGGIATTVARLEAILTAHTHGFTKAMDKAETKMQKTSRAATYAGTAIAGGLAFGLEKSVKAAMHAQASQARLEVAFHNAGLKAGAYEKQIKAVEKSSRTLGFTEEDVHTALGSLITSTGSVKDSMRQLSIAEDLARFKGVGLEQATKALTMAHAGSLRPLKQLGIDITKSTDAVDKLKAATKDHTTTQYQSALLTAQLADKTATFGKVLDVVTAKVHGQADAYSKTAAGAMQQFKAQLNFLEISLGTALLPAITKVTAAAAKMTAWLSAHPKLAKVLVIALGALATALITASVAQRLMNLAALANPYVAVAAALITLTILTIKYRNQIMETFNWVKAHWPLLATIIGGPLGFAIAKLIQNWGALVSAIQPAITAVHGVSSAISHLVGWLMKAVGYVKSLVGLLGKIPSIHIGLPHLPFGDASGSGSGIYSARAAAEGKAFGVGKQLWDEIGMGEQVGLSVTSGYRPGAVTKHGTPSDHGVFPSHAVDMAGSAGGMASLFKALIGRKEVKQAFYDPLGSIFGGVRSSYREGGHSDHIHVAEYDKGGYLRPGWNLAYNGLGRPEQVGGGDIIIPVSVGGEHIATVIFDQLRRKAKVFENRNGRPAFGGA